MIESLAARVAGEFYLDASEAGRAWAAGRAFNLIHLATASKIDVFPLTGNLFHETELARSRPENWMTAEGTAIIVPVASAEDTVISKLAWYRDGEGVSDRQWNDVLGIAGRSNLDWAYVRQWAAILDVSELAEKLNHETDQLRRD